MAVAQPILDRDLPTRVHAFPATVRTNEPFMHLFGGVDLRERIEHGACPNTWVDIVHKLRFYRGRDTAIIIIHKFSAAQRRLRWLERARAALLARMHMH